MDQIIGRSIVAGNTDFPFTEFISLSTARQSFLRQALLFLYSGAALLLVTMLTISWHSLRAARANPVESLR